MKGVYRNKAITPTFDIKKAAIEKINYAKDRITSIILPLDGISQEGADEVIKALDELAASIESGYELGDNKYPFDPLKHYNVKKAIDDAKPDANAWVRMNDDLASIVKAFSVQSKAGDEVIIKTLADEKEVEDFVLEVELEQQKANESNAQEQNEENNSNWIIIVIIAVCAFVGISAVIIAIVIVSKSKKSNKAVSEPKVTEGTVSEEQTTENTESKE